MTIREAQKLYKKATKANEAFSDSIAYIRYASAEDFSPSMAIESARKAIKAHKAIEKIANSIGVDIDTLALHMIDEEMFVLWILADRIEFVSNEHEEKEVE